ncbi:hypothetical_protein [Leishmania infantum]|uniref:Hypothetical_protein n=1 Tax=Leishmania infantum TaxID=5671 RepID=A0A6L0WMV4_LEIIN|nr:hypothetical_protein [Leishmania infantum]SUZ39298.1 hypothetical_protein [Leishmania infantum]
MRSTAAATPTAAQAARILSLEQKLQALPTEQDHYRRHYEEPEGVCWDVLDDLAENEGRGAHDSTGIGPPSAEDGAPLLDASSSPPSRLASPATAPRASAGRHGLGYPVSASHDGPHSHPSLCSDATPAGVSSRRATQRHLSDHPPPSRRTTISSSRPDPRLRCSGEADVLSPQETQLLLRRLRRLHQWMGDLVTGVSAATSSGCADVGCRGDGALRDPSATATEVIANVCPCSDSSAACSAFPLSARESPLKRVTALRLHRVVDDLFMLFTQLQATLTDVVWCTSHPPALSTPVRTHLAHDVEVERLRAINQQLRRTLRGYEQSHQTASEAPAPRPYDSIKASRRAAPPLSSPPPPAGYAASHESGLFIALRRR